MSLGKQAKTLSRGQIEAVLGYLAKTRHAAHNRVIFLLSAKAGLRAKEIARLTWWMTNDSQGEIGRAICLQDSASKGKSGRMIPINEELRTALIEYRRMVPHAGPHVICTERAGHLAAGHSQSLPPLVSAPWVRGLLQSQRQAHFYNKCRPKDFDSRGIAAGRSSIWRGTRTYGQLSGTLRRTRRPMRALLS
jgi:integrase